MRLGLKLVNAPWEDPAVFVELEGQPGAWLIDCGTLTPLRPRDLQRVDRVFLTHAHIDHFIGFDALLRMHLGTSGTLTFYGPEGLSAHVRGRLTGYAWNLVEDSGLILEVCELLPEQALWTRFECRRRFAEEPGPRAPHEGLLALPGGVNLRFAWMEHGVPCLAWVLEEPTGHSVDREALRATGLAPGPWLSELKRLAGGGELSGDLQIDGRAFEARELAGRVLLSRPGRRMAYVTDTIFNKKTVAALRQVARPVDELWCEASYLHPQREKARENLHMTARQAGRLAAELQASRLHLFHYSRRYQKDPAPHLAEAREAFAQTLAPPRYGSSGGPLEASIASSSSSSSTGIPSS